MKYFKNIPDRPLTNWLIMLVMATAIMMLLSRDSYLYLLGPRCDSACFFMCGKAWMNGMVPYVDFADSKGPLLWLIYGVGYLLSHYDYHGVFWVSVIVYSFTFYFLFKTARIFVNHRSQALLAVLMTSVFIFNPITHNETRAEDFCNFFTALSLWQLFKLLYGEHIGHSTLKAFFLFGVSIGGTLLIKYNITAMCCIFPAIGLYHTIRNHNSILRPIITCAAGFFTITTPFIIYLLLQESFTSFIQEYFINTLQTIENNKVYYGVRNITLFTLVLAISILPLSYKLKNYKWVPLIIYAAYVFTTLYSAKFGYYFSILNIFTIFPTTVLSLIARSFWKTTLSSTLVILSLFTAYNIFVLPGSLWDEINKKEIKEVTEIFNLVSKPKVVVTDLDNGYGITSGSLPACKYWMLQNGHLPTMYENILDCILKKRCDFAVIYERRFRVHDLQRKMKELGYNLVYTYNDGGEVFKAPNRTQP